MCKKLNHVFCTSDASGNLSIKVHSGSPFIIVGVASVDTLTGPITEAKPCVKITSGLSDIEVFAQMVFSSDNGIQFLNACFIKDSDYNPDADIKLITIPSIVSHRFIVFFYEL
jgi:hypothetical protein